MIRHLCWYVFFTAVVAWVNIQAQVMPGQSHNILDRVGSQSSRTLIDRAWGAVKNERYDSALVYYTIVASRYKENSPHEEVVMSATASVNVGYIWLAWRMNGTEAYPWLMNARDIAKRHKLPEVEIGVNSNLGQMIYALSIFEAPVLRKKYSGEPARPQNPVILDWSPYDMEQQSSYFTFSLPQVDVNGNALSTDNMFYVLYDGDEEIELDPDLFPNVPEYMVEIPYNWWCYDVVPNGPVRTVWFSYYVTDPGVKLMYDMSDGSVLSSDTVYVNMSGINTVQASSSVTSEEYYDLSGRRVTEAYKGIVVKRSYHSDGSVTTSKQIMK